MRRALNGKVTLVELGFLAFHAALILICLQWGYHRYRSWRTAVGAAIVMVVLLAFVGTAFGVLVSITYAGISYPSCRTGKCRSFNYRSGRLENNQQVLICACGIPYRHRGRRFYEVQPDGSLRPYKVWRAFRGWFPDG